MGYYDPEKRKYISKYNRLASLRTSESIYTSETEREREIQKIVDRMQDIPDEYFLGDESLTVKNAKKRSRKKRKTAKSAESK